MGDPGSGPGTCWEPVGGSSEVGGLTSRRLRRRPASLPMPSSTTPTTSRAPRVRGREEPAGVGKGLTPDANKATPSLGIKTPPAQRTRLRLRKRDQNVSASANGPGRVVSTVRSPSYRRLSLVLTVICLCRFEGSGT